MAQQSHHFTSSMSAMPHDQQRSVQSAHFPQQQQQQPTPGTDDVATPLPHQHGLDDELYNHDHDHYSALRHELLHKDGMAADDSAISIKTGSKHAEMAVETFLTQHIPTQYNPMGANDGKPQDGQKQADKDPNTKFCYRHRPDMKCRRQANGPSMEQLQNRMSRESQSDQQALSQVWSIFSAAPARLRILMLEGMIAQCCNPQLSFIANRVREELKIDFLTALPDELCFNILCYLDTASLCKAAQVCQRWRSLADDDVVWHKMCEQHIDRKCTKCGWGLPLLERKRLRIEKRKIQLRANGRGLNQWSPDITSTPEGAAADSQSGLAVPKGPKRSCDEEPQTDVATKKQRMSAAETGLVGIEGNDAYFAPRKRPWKDVYKDRYKVGTAWKHGRCSTKIFRGHTNGVMCLQFDDTIMASGSYDRTVIIWDVNTGERIRTLSGHASGIRCLQFEGNRLWTGSLDSTLKLWDWKTGTCLKTYQAHTDGIICLHATARYTATGSRDKTIRVYDNRDRITFLLRGHTDWVNSIKIDEDSRTLFSASDDLTVKLWDLDTKECVRTFEGHVGQVQQVVPMPVEFDLDSSAMTPDQDDDASSTCSVTVSASHQHHEPSRQSFWPRDPERPAPPRYMLTGALDSTIRLWDTHLKTSSSSHSARDPTLQTTSGFEIIPTDPLTNSHTPRAQACIRTFFGHVEGIWALAADHLRLISGSQDTMIKVWDPRTGKCERTFTGHQGPVTCAWLSDSRVASGSEDCDVRMLCFGDG